MTCFARKIHSALALQVNGWMKNRKHMLKGSFTMHSYSGRVSLLWEYYDIV